MPSCCKRRLFQYPFASFTAARSRLPSAPRPRSQTVATSSKPNVAGSNEEGDAAMARHIDFALPLNESRSLSSLPSVCRTIKLKRAMPDADTQVKSSQGESAKIKLCKKEDTK